MKKFITIIAILFSLQANAGFINLSVDGNYNKGDLIDVYLTVSNPEQDIAEIDFDVLFDDSILEFNSFSFDYNSFEWDPLFEMVGLVGPDALNIYALWNFAEDLPLGDFTLGHITFEAISNGNAEFDIDEVFFGDFFGDSLENSAVVNIDSLSVPEPSALALFALGLFGLTRYRKS